LLAAFCPSNIAFAANTAAPAGFEICKILTDDRARLECFRRLLTGESRDTTTTDPARPREVWRLIRTPDPRGGPDAVAILRAADTTQSDPDLAGLMIRCHEKQPLEVQLALVRPFPPRSMRNVVLGSGAKQSLLRAETSQASTALILPIDATEFTIGAWQGLKELTVIINDPVSDIHGVIPLDGLAPALAQLAASCPPG
jgi:hypothetical protein